MSYDLLLKGGHVVDPAQGLDGPFDVAFANGRVARVAPAISAADAARDASGLYVVPGLIDLHTHVYWGSTYLGVDADSIAPAAGMTTAVDAGSAGAGTFRGLVAHIARRAEVRILAFVNLSYIGIVTGGRAISVPEAEDLRLLNIAECAAAVKANPEHAVGIKIRVGASSTGHLGAMPLHMAIRASELGSTDDRVRNHAAL